MSYWPELRDSLMTAARREYEAPSPDREPTRPRRRARLFSLPRLSSIAVLLATVSAVAVAVIALTVVRPHSQSSSSPLGRSSETTNERAAHTAAAAVLRQLVLPAGAVRSGLVPGTPADLWTPPDVISTPHHVDTFAVWRLPESAKRVIAFIEAHQPAGSSVGMGSESTSSAATVGSGQSNPVFEGATQVFNFPGNSSTRIWRELAIAVDRMPGGGSVLRADGEAGWLQPRSVEEQFPAAIDRVKVTTFKPSRRQGQLSRTEWTKSRRRIQRLVALLNALPMLQQHVHRCPGDTGLRGLYAFYSTGHVHPVATALYNPFCGSIRVTIGGRSQPSLQIGLPDRNIVRELSQTRELMSFGSVPLDATLTIRGAL
jgi:hypothetical protein